MLSLEQLSVKIEPIALLKREIRQRSETPSYKPTRTHPNRHVQLIQPEIQTPRKSSVSPGKRIHPYTHAQELAMGGHTASGPAHNYFQSPSLFF